MHFFTDAKKRKQTITIETYVVEKVDGMLDTDKISSCIFLKIKI